VAGTRVSLDSIACCSFSASQPSGAPRRHCHPLCALSGSMPLVISFSFQPESVRPRFQADNDLRSSIRRGVLRREPAVDFASAMDAALDGLPDPEVLKLAAMQGRPMTRIRWVDQIVWLPI
jgi:hypothetical protein